MSIGFARLASAGMSASSRVRVSSASGGSARPAASQASAHMIPSPPAFVSTATLRPRGAGCVESSVATSMSSSREPARMTPAWWKSASTATSAPARAAVCEPAARAPLGVVPLLTARIGLLRATRRASSANLRGLPNDSTYNRTTSVSGSSSHHSSRSFEETSALLPIETNADNPRPRDSAASSIASPSAPLWEEKPMLPTGAWREANVAFSRVAAEATPRQFGPMRRAPWARTRASN